jgi:hypothetical protein
VPNLAPEISITALPRNPSLQYVGIGEVIPRHLASSVEIATTGFCYPGEIYFIINVIKIASHESNSADAFHRAQAEDSENTCDARRGGRGQVQRKKALADMTYAHSRVHTRFIADEFYTIQPSPFPSH